MLIKAAINGGRTRAQHAAVPVSPAEQAAAVTDCLKAGVDVIHLHVRSTSAANEKESLEAVDVERTLSAVRAAAPNAAIGVSTGAWIIPDAAARLQAVAAWQVQPDFASVNFSEDGAAELAKLLLARGVGVEAGLIDLNSAQVLVASGLLEACLRVLLEPQEQQMERALESVRAMEEVLKSARLDRPVVLHGTEATTWPMLDEAITRGYGIRIGLEDTLRMPDGRVAKDNIELVTEAVRQARKRAGASPPS
jgi:uncharacterized protein (DUF849 family)